MTEYYFRVPRGKYSNGQGEVAELPDRSAACNHALAIWSGLAREIAAELKSEPEWRMEVADRSGKVLIKLSALIEIAE
jgi:hypothetical protein